MVAIMSWYTLHCALDFWHGIIIFLCSYGVYDLLKGDGWIMLRCLSSQFHCWRFIIDIGGSLCVEYIIIFLILLDGIMFHLEFGMDFLVIGTHAYKET